MPDTHTPAAAPEAPCLDPFALARALSGAHLIGGRLVPARSGRVFPPWSTRRPARRWPRPPMATPPMSRRR
ncbi:hypothetical protein [Teichococcus cervicalis]